MALEPATLTNVSKAGQSPIKVQFNPTEYGIDRGASYADLPVPGLRMPLLQFVRGESETLSLDLFLDGTNERKTAAPGDTVEGRLKKLRIFVRIDPDLHAPPVCEFKWRKVRFQGVVTSFRERYTLFDESGAVLRARVTLSLKSYQSVQAQLHRTNNKSPDRTRVRVVRDGETLAQIANEAYGSPRLWRAIAEANGIERPRFLEAGMPLRIPAL